jgi:hypothetical protein
MAASSMGTTMTPAKRHPKKLLPAAELVPEQDVVAFLLSGFQFERRGMLFPFVGRSADCAITITL